MPVKLEDRPTETVREEVIDQLIMNYSHGVISLEAFERRLDAATSTDDNVELKALVEDLDMQVDDSYLDSKKSDFGLNYGQSYQQADDVIYSILGNKERSGPWLVGKDMQVFSVLSDTTLDFSQAKFSHPTVNIKIVNALSDMKIKVPEHVNVVSKVFCIAGSIKNKAKGQGAMGGPTIYIEGFSILSELKISIKREGKEKWISFAEYMKKTFS